MKVAKRVNAIDLIPAYGRTYATTQSCEADFHKGMDFRTRGGLHGGSYTSVRDLMRLKELGYTEVHLYVNTRTDCEDRTVIVL